MVPVSLQRSQLVDIERNWEGQRWKYQYRDRTKDKKNVLVERALIIPYNFSIKDTNVTNLVIQHKL
jgi:hypothetical protein